MCVLTYIPTGNKGYILTSNRDEAVARETATPPRKYTINGHQVFYPKDPLSDGTWIAGSKALSLCLLNGGVSRHIPHPPYRQSRGRIIPDFFEFGSVTTFVERYDFDGIEPFTLVVIENSHELFAHELRWNGKQISTEKIDVSRPQIWSSVTLYTPQVIEARKQWFTNFLQQPVSADSVLDFHQNGGVGDIRNDLRINRDNVLKTLSTTQYVINEYYFTIYYEDLLNQRKYNYRVIE
ncbi:NRDE family protein [Emticicia sp. 21SJ11W-3]|uniref:NRDE family protein n=1 Tax=Emticicia sp. 21SJ11W-3 TaxID=2916755 RepID=UPI00209E0AEB|nr:NRDE family protein [Emticicia sp. 21SJ11W-3]UTA66888.1 NRDE family protein [Emticicia sp. 21SJ11W-3]